MRAEYLVDEARGRRNDGYNEWTLIGQQKHQREHGNRSETNMDYEE